jgi:hypothetical protein
MGIRISLRSYNNSVTKFAKRAGINNSSMRRYKKGLAFACEKQCNKIHQCACQIKNYSYFSAAHYQPHSFKSSYRVIRIQSGSGWFRWAYDIRA